MILNLNDYEEAGEVKAFRIKRICPIDGGEMLPTGKCLLMLPKLYEHACNICRQHTDNFTFIYPYITYREIKNATNK